MKKIKKVTKASKNFVVKHKLAIGVVTTAVICTAINRNALSAYSEFLEEKGLTEEFIGENAIIVK
jgi:hypothetical protein